MSLSLSEAVNVQSSLALGLKKSALPKPGADPLATIALSAERTAFADDLTHVPITANNQNLPEDVRPVLPPALRPLLLRAISSPQGNSAAWEALCRNLHRQLNRAGFRLHPFDLPRLNKYLNAVELTPGSYDYWYHQQLSHTANQQPTEAIIWDNWQEFNKGEQLAFLQAQRRLDADATRIAIEQAFAGATAAMRQTYLEAMAINLSVADQPLLTSLGQDRSSKVVELAHQLLARFPDTEAAEQNQEAVKGRLETHLISRKIGLVKQKGKKASETLQEFAALIDYMPIDNIAAAVNIALENLPNKIDKELAAPFAKSAAFVGRYELAIQFLQKEDEKYVLNQLPTISSWFSTAPETAKLAFAQWLIPLISNLDGLQSYALILLYDLLQQPLPDSLAGNLLAGKAVKILCEQSRSDNTYQANASMESLALFAVLLPASQHQLFLDKVKEFPFKSGLNPHHYLNFIAALNDHTVFRIIL